MTLSRYLNLGKVGKPHGLKGAFFVSGRDEALPKVDRIYIGSKPESTPSVRITSMKWQGDRSVLEIESIRDRESAEAILHQDIWIERSQLKLEATDCLWIDLEGKVVWTSDHMELGRISDVANYGASDIVEIVKGKQRMSLPLIQDYFKWPVQPEKIEVKQDLSFFSDLWEDIHGA
jgi:16S rRNA processing protein RimM